MAVTRHSRSVDPIGADVAMAGVLALLVDEREARVKEDKTVAKTEVLLANVGLSVDDIQALTGKKSDAIRKTIQRGRAK
jgi:DNA-directed RNA polymerase specialized sigma24 family protein